MRLFGLGRKKKSKEEEELDDEEEDEGDEEDKKKKPARRKFKDLNPQNSRRRKLPPKPWGKKERFLIFVFFAGTTLTSALLAASSRSWELPGLKQVEVPDLSLRQEYEFVNNTPPTNSTNSQAIVEQVKSLTANYSGVYAIQIIDLASSAAFGVEDKRVMQAASLIKLPVMSALYKEAENGRIDLDSTYTLKASDKTSGSGSLYYKPEGTKVTYRELGRLMGEQSDNTAFTIVRKVLGDAAINNHIKQIGMESTNLDENRTTPSDIGLFFKKLYNGQIVNEEHSKDLLLSLTNTIYEDWIPAYVDEGIKVAHKYGREVHVINDAGVIYTPKPFVMVVMTQGIIDSEAQSILPQIIHMLFEYQKAR